MWRVHAAAREEAFDAVVLAGSASATAKLLEDSGAHNSPQLAQSMTNWTAQTRALRFEEIATVYARADKVRLAQPMQALQSDPSSPAQFVFDKGQLGGPAGLLAFVVSANTDNRDIVQTRVLAQGNRQLSSFLGGSTLAIVQTIIEKRATFACTPGLQRPPTHIAPGLLACGDYIEGPYPATLEGAIRSGVYAGCAAFS